MEAQIITKPSKTPSDKRAAPTEPDTKEAWPGFKLGLWQRDINVSLLQNNNAAFNSSGNLTAIPAFGAMIGYTHKWTDYLRSTVS